MLIDHYSLISRRTDLTPLHCSGWSCSPRTGAHTGRDWTDWARLVPCYDRTLCTRTYLCLQALGSHSVVIVTSFMLFTTTTIESDNVPVGCDDVCVRSVFVSCRHGSIPPPSSLLPSRSVLHSAHISSLLTEMYHPDPDDLSALWFAGIYSSNSPTKKELRRIINILYSFTIPCEGTPVRA